MVIFKAFTLRSYLEVPESSLLKRDLSGGVPISWLQKGPVLFRSVGSDSLNSYLLWKAARPVLKADGKEKGVTRLVLIPFLPMGM